MNVGEWTETMAQIARERQALNGAYDDLQRRLETEAGEARRAGVKRPLEELMPELVETIALLENFVDIEREHADKLYRLLLETLRRLAEAYEIEVPPDWPSGSAAGQRQ